MGPFHWRKRRTCARGFASSLPPGRPGGAPSSFFPEKKSRRINYRNLDVATVAAEWSYLEWPVSSADLEKLRGVRFIFTSGNHALEIEGVELLENGKVIARDQHAGLAGKPSHGNFYQLSLPKGIHANNGCSLRARVRPMGGKSSNGKLELVKE